MWHEGFYCGAATESAIKDTTIYTVCLSVCELEENDENCNGARDPMSHRASIGRIGSGHVSVANPSLSNYPGPFFLSPALFFLRLVSRLSDHCATTVVFLCASWLVCVTAIHDGNMSNLRAAAVVAVVFFSGTSNVFRHDQNTASTQILGRYLLDLKDSRGCRRGLQLSFFA